MAFTLGESAPHPAFGHPLPAYAGRGMSIEHVRDSTPFAPTQVGEKVAEGRMRGLNLRPLRAMPAVESRPCADG